MNAIEIRDLCKDYGDFQLDHVNLTLPEGCVMGFIGENGAGKSTTIHILLDLIRADSGEVLLYGEPHTSVFPALKEDIGVVLDETCFPETLNLREISSIMRSAYKNWSAETFFGYTNRFRLPEKKKVKDYSRGMKMKLSIAVAMSHGARLLILDEATSGLDPVVRDELLDLFFEFVQDEKHSIFISSHITSDLEKICDYVTFLHHGRVLLSEEKDILCERLGILKCTREQLKELDNQAVLGVRESAFGSEALVEREKVPAGLMIEHASLDDIIVFLSKGEH